MPVTVSINGSSGSFAKGVTLFSCAETLGTRPFSSCDQHGKCRECVLEILAGASALNERTALEEHLDGDYRLSCCAKIAGDSGSIEIKSPSHGKLQILETGKGKTAHDQALTLNPAVKRAGDRIFIDDAEIGAAGASIYGAAVDAGTTTVAYRIYDLENGELVCGGSFENPQRFAGSDIMARISYDTTHGGRLLQRVIINGLSDALKRLPIKLEHIYEMVIAGNSAMRDLFFGLNVESIGQKPYHSVSEQELREGVRQTTALFSNAKKLRLPIHPEARVYGLPLVGSHVGADTAACLLALNMDRSEDIVTVMDIGTNTEVACGNRDRLSVASCPAGPAFEGGAVSCGMPGWEGAIEHVRINGVARPRFSVIGNTEPLGVCGSGLIDLLSELRLTGQMDEFGRFTRGESSFTLDGKSGISLHEADINELAQAKGANVAGLQILVKNSQLEFADLSRLFLAGGFAGYLDIESAKNIGFIPDIPSERIRSAGNASIEGASIALLSVERREDLDAYVKRATHVELETDEHFFDYFVEGCQFKPFHKVPAF